MKSELDDLKAFLAVARAGGFREAARSTGVSASSLSDSVRRLETRLSVRLLNRTTRSVAPTDAGKSLLARVAPALGEIESALDTVVASGGKPAGTLRLNVPVSAARLVLPAIVPDFLAAFPDIRLELFAEDAFVDVLAAGCDAGIRYDERLEQDMIALPIGPRVQRFATAAAPSYLDRRGRPEHPRDLLAHNCIRSRFASGVMNLWEYERDGDVMQIDPAGQFVVSAGGATDLAVEAALAGTGIVCLFEEWLRPHLDSGALQPVLSDWWPSFSGPFLYYPGRRLVPAPLRAFIDFVRQNGSR